MTGGADMIDEMRLFAAFPAATRRYIVRSLDFGLPRGDPMTRWVGGFFDMGPLMARADRYAAVPETRRALAGAKALERWMPEFVVLQRCADFDLQWDEVGDFSAFGFLYERLFGPAVRPWLTGVFAAAVASPGVVREAGSAALVSLTMFDGPDWNIDAPPPRFLPEWDGD